MNASCIVKFNIVSGSLFIIQTSSYHERKLGIQFSKQQSKNLRFLFVLDFFHFLKHVNSLGNSHQSSLEETIYAYTDHHYGLMVYNVYNHNANWFSSLGI